MLGLSAKSKICLCRRLALISSFGLFFFCLILGFAFAQSELSISSATASTYYSVSYAPAKAIDNNFSTYWWGKSGKSYWWLRLDLGKAYSLNQISVWWNKTYKIGTATIYLDKNLSS